MKSNLFILIILVCSAYKANAQNWTLVNSNTTNDIIDITFRDDSLGFFLTNTGKLFYSPDSGNHWRLVHQDTNLVSGEIAVTKDSIFWYAPDINGTPMKSRSSLSTFAFTKDTIDRLPLRPVFWQNEIWDVYKVNQSLGGSPARSVEQFSVSERFIWATNAGKMFSSDNFGSTWQEHQFTTMLLSSSPYQGYYNGSSNILTVIQYPTTIYTTTDDRTWTFNTTETNGLYFYFINSTKLLAYNFLVTSPKIYQSIDGGRTFTTESLIDIPSGIYSRYNNNKAIFIYGKNGMLYKSTNAGGLLSIDPLEKKSDFVLYPNPSHETIQLQYPNNINIERISLLDEQGKTIKDFRSGFESLNIKGIPSGHYLLFIQSQEGNATQQLIIQ